MPTEPVIFHVKDAAMWTGLPYDVAENIRVNSGIRRIV